MAELWKLPVVFVIENNQYAMGTSVNRSSAEDQLYRRGESFRIPGIQVDGMDVLAARGAAEEALAWVRSEEHTSELQSLMRISYAVFCLKKTLNTTQTRQQNTSQLCITTKQNTIIM